MNYFIFHDALSSGNLITCSYEEKVDRNLIYLIICSSKSGYSNLVSGLADVRCSLKLHFPFDKMFR